MKNIYLWALGFIVVGALMGWILGSTYITSQASIDNGTVLGIGGGPGVSNPLETNSKLSDFRVEVNSLFRDHIVLVGEYVDALIEGKDVTPLKAAIDDNTNSIADLVGSVYGNDVKNRFTIMWKQHIQEYDNYTKAAIAKNAGGKVAAKNNLNAMADELGASLKQVQTGNVDASKLSGYMKQHAFGTLLIIDAKVSGDEAKIIQLQKSADDQVGNFADYFSQLAASQNPDMFSVK